MPRAFIVYSSKRHVNYIDEVLSVIKSVLDSFNIEIIPLGEGFRGVRYIPVMIRKNISESDFGIVILDGLRPNVTYELGLLQMRDIDVIPLIKDDAQLSVKSFYYNPQKRYYDSKLAFGEWRFQRRAFEKLIEPYIVIPEHFSDCLGMYEIRYTTIDDTMENGSLGKKLREEITKIIPHLRSRTGSGFEELYKLFPEFEIGLLDEAIHVLSLFSVVGWNQYYNGDMTFQSIREEFVSLFINQTVSVDQINTIFNSLLERPESIIKNYGRYLTIDSEKLLNQSFTYLLQNPEIFRKYYIRILNSPLTELKRRFVDRITSSDVLSNNIVEAIGNYIFDRSGLFPDISTIQDKESCQFFVSTACINPIKALDLLYNWIYPLTPTEIEDLFPFQSTIAAPGNPQDDVLWFLNGAAKNDNFFKQSMEILFEFSLPVILYEEQILTDIHSGVQKLALDRFIEQCYSLAGEVNVSTRWDFIKNLSWSEDWSNDFKKSTIILKFRVIQAFLQRSWMIPGPVRKGSIKVSHYRILNGINYENLENCRSEAYQLIMEWLDHPDIYANIYDSLFEYYYRHLSECLRYISWDKIKSLFLRIFSRNSHKMIEILSQIDKLHAYGGLRESYSEEHLHQLFQFQEELEDRLTITDLFRRKMNYSVYTPEVIGMFSDQTGREVFINSIKIEMIEKYLELDEAKSKEITDVLLFEEFNQSYEIGLNLQNYLTWEEIRTKIDYCTGVIERKRIEKVSNFYIGLWSALFNANKEEWENLLDHYWNNLIIRPYFEKILRLTDRYFNEFRWNKYLELFNLRLISPIEYTNVIYHKELISIEDIRSILIGCLRYYEEMISSDIHYPIENYVRFIWSIERLISGKEGLLDNVLAESFLHTFEPINFDILSQLYNTDIIMRIGQKSEQNFNSWLKIGFTLNEHNDDFLLKCSDIFIDSLFQIIEELFALPPVRGEATEDHHMALSFEVQGDPRILLKFTDEQINSLYDLNPSMLGTLFGRLIRNISINDDFPPILRNLIIQHNEDSNFKDSLFREFSGGVRTFVGDNYDQQYEGDYARITKWRESAINKIFREWLQQLHVHIDSLRKESRDFWREREVE
ncbi:hypothetical protein LCGC14_0842150 [marine sediment metagenome]|uniref:Uncharacterized protein n=1 Tax=marine sediment metagenome TaxID=412755 RepID=A0A0F9RXF9_9ZZZZ